jgi:hypothetical protein
MATFKTVVNEVEITFDTSWCNNDGDGWSFMVLATVEDSHEPRFDDSIRTSIPEYYDINRVLKSLDEPSWPSDELPHPQIGQASMSTLKDISEKINSIANESYPAF